MKLLRTLTETLNDSQPTSEDTIATLKDLYDQLEMKQELISSLDAKILEGTTDYTEIETEILQTKEINSSVSVAKVKITQHLNSSTSAITPPQRTDSHTVPSSEPVHEHITWLPNLDLPQFTGNPHHWQSFWDCFEDAVQNNPSHLECRSRISTHYCMEMQHVS